MIQLLTIQAVFGSKIENEVKLKYAQWVNVLPHTKKSSTNIWC